MNTKEKLFSKSVRISKKELSDLVEICRTEHLPEAAILRRWIREGIIGYKLEKAIEGYRRQELSLSEAATFAQIPVRDLMRKLAQESIPVVSSDSNFDAAVGSLSEQFDTTELLEALEHIRSVESTD